MEFTFIVILILVAIGCLILWHSLTAKTFVIGAGFYAAMTAMFQDSMGYEKYIAWAQGHFIRPSVLTWIMFSLLAITSLIHLITNILKGR